MRKRIVATIAAGAAAVLMLSGFDSAMTVQKLSENAQSALSQVNSLSMDLEGDASASLRISQGGESGATMDVPVNGTLSIAAALMMDPFEMQVEMDYNAEAMGQGMGSSMSMYIVETEDGSAEAYLGTYSDEEGMLWQAETVDAQNLSQVKSVVRSLLAGDTSALNSLGMNSTSADPAAALDVAKKYQEQMLGMAALSPQSVTINGKECYQVVADLSGNDLMPVFTDALAASGQAVDEMSQQVIAAILGGIRLHMESELDVQNFLPVHALIDLGESDFSAIGSLLVSSMMGGGAGDASAQIEVSALKLEGNFDCNNQVSVTVPEEARAAADGSGSPVNPEELIGSFLGSGSTGSTGGADSTGSTGDLSGTDSFDGADEGPVQNADGSYRIRYEDYLGNTKEADIVPPAGLKLSYGSENYLSFSSEDHKLSVSYSMYSQGTPQETVEDDLDVSYMEGNADYSDVTRTEVMQTALPDGTAVYYGHKGYQYGDYRLGATCCAVQAGNWVVDIEIQPQDERYNYVEASEQDVITYAGCVRPTA